MCNIFRIPVNVTPPYEFKGFGFSIDLDGLFWVLCIVVLVDYIITIILVDKKNKANLKNAVFSIFKYTGNIIVLVLSDIITDVLLNDSGITRNAIAMILIAERLYVMIPKLKMMGVPIPKQLVNLVSTLYLKDVEDFKEQITPTKCNCNENESEVENGNQENNKLDV